jgi:1-deoxy-D-xylulose-5-phosphate reductoisomerase
MAIKTISVLGSTGSVGVQSLAVACELGVKIFALSAGENIILLKKQIEKFCPKFVCVKFEKDAKLLSEEFKNINFLSGTEGIEKIASLEEPEIVINAVSGFAGTFPCFAAVGAGKKIALANKESIVSLGSVLINAVRKNGSEILPIDSEHSAVWQCLQGVKSKPKRLILTASGGPFSGKKQKDLETIKAADALKHPIWKMGSKISIDSATMINKGLEIIEASYLFNFDPFKIDIVIHPESVVHSMVELEDGTVLAQLGKPDMKIPIRHALIYGLKSKPKNINESFASVISRYKSLTFYEPDIHKGTLFDFCRCAILKGNGVTCALSAANEIAVNAFLNEKIGFLDIEKTVRAVTENFKILNAKTFEEIVRIYSLASENALKFIKSLKLGSNKNE